VKKRSSLENSRSSNGLRPSFLQCWIRNQYGIVPWIICTRSRSDEPPCFPRLSTMNMTKEVLAATFTVQSNLGGPSGGFNWNDCPEGIRPKIVTGWVAWVYCVKLKSRHCCRLSGSSKLKSTPGSVRLQVAPVEGGLAVKRAEVPPVPNP